MTVPVEDTDSTSTNEEALDTDAESDLENDDFSFDDVDSDETEESDESDETEAATEESEETEEESDVDEGNQSQDEESKEADTTSKEDKQPKSAQEAFREREAQREAKRQAQEKEQQEYIGAAKDDQDAALRQLQVDAYNNKVEFNLSKLETGIDKAVAAIDLFQTGTVEVREELASALDDFERMYVRRDPRGNPVEVKGDVYQFLQKKAESIRRLTDAGARQQQTAKKSTKARTDAVPSRAPKEPKVDPDLAAFDEWIDSNG